MGCGVAKPEWHDVYNLTVKAIFGSRGTSSECKKTRDDVNSQAETLFCRVAGRKYERRSLSSSASQGSSAADVVTFAMAVQYAEDVWHLSRLHSFSGVLMTIAAAQVTGVSGPDAEFDPLQLLHWAIFICEFYHIVSLLEYCEPFDEVIATLFARMHTSIRRASAGEGTKNGSSTHKGAGENKLMRKFFSATVPANAVSAAVIKYIAKELPGIFDPDAASLTAYPIVLPTRPKKGSFNAVNVRNSIVEMCFAHSSSTSAASSMHSLTSAQWGVVDSQSMLSVSSLTSDISFGHFVCLLLLKYIRLFRFDTMNSHESNSRLRPVLPESPTLHSSSLGGATSTSAGLTVGVTPHSMTIDILLAVLKEHRALAVQLRERESVPDGLKHKLTLRIGELNRELVGVFRLATSSDTAPLTERRAYEFFYAHVECGEPKPTRQTYERIVREAFSRVCAKSGRYGGDSNGASAHAVAMEGQVIASLPDFCALLETVLTALTLSQVSGVRLNTEEMRRIDEVTTRLAKSETTATRPLVDVASMQKTWWATKCNELPYTSHTMDQRKRLVLLHELSSHSHPSARQRSKDADGGHALRCDALVHILNVRHDLSHLLYYYCCRARMPAAGDAVQSIAMASYDLDKTASEEECVHFVQACVSTVNEIIIQGGEVGARGGEYVRKENFRFFLQYIHDFLLIFFSLHDLLEYYRGHANLCCIKTFLAALSRVVETRACKGSGRMVINDIFTIIQYQQNRLNGEADVIKSTTLQNPTSVSDESAYDTCNNFFAQLCRDREFVCHVAHAAAAILLKIQFTVHCTVERVLSERQLLTFKEDMRSVDVNSAGGDDAYTAANSSTLTVYMSAMQTYWQRLRSLLPFGDSSTERVQRDELFEKMNTNKRNYLTLENIRYGITSVLPLTYFRSDLTPVFFRAFVAVLEKSLIKEDEPYLNIENEQFIEKSEFGDFLYYFYRYMELYYMYDVLLCAGYVDPDTLHISPEKQQPSSAVVPTNAHPANPEDKLHLPCNIFDHYNNRPIYNKMDHVEINALCLAACNPTQLVAEAMKLPKEVTVDQFVNARCLLRFWGFYMADPLYVFKYIHRYCTEDNGKLYFTWFATWASEHGLRPQGYYRASYVDDTAFMSVEQVCMNNMSKVYT